MDLVSDLEWLYRQDLVKIHHGQLPFLGLTLRRLLSPIKIRNGFIDRTSRRLVRLRSRF